MRRYPILVPLILLIMCITTLVSVGEDFRSAVSLPQSAAVVLDCSGSMDGNKLEHLKEAAKLIGFLYQGQLTVVPFADSAVTQTFELPPDREAFSRLIDNLSAGDGTSYPAALRVLRNLPSEATVLFVSDGENTEGDDQSVLKLIDTLALRFFTIGVSAPEGANHLLAQMAEASGGAHIAVEQSEDLVETLVGLVLGLAGYRDHRPTQTELHCPKVVGRAIVFTYDGRSEITGTAPMQARPDELLANLPGEPVHVQLVDLPQATDLDIELVAARSPQARIAHVLRSDLIRADLQVDSATALAGRQLHVATEFSLADGTPIDPRTRKDLAVQYRLLDEHGNEVDSDTAAPSQSEPRLQGELTIQSPGQYRVVQSSTQTAGNLDFQEEQARTIVATESTVLVADPVELGATSTAGRRFLVKTKIRPRNPDVQAPRNLSAKLRDHVQDLQLLDVQYGQDLLCLTFEARTAGEYKGVLSVLPGVGEPFSSLDVPYTFDIKPAPKRPDRFSAQYNLGSTLPSAGKTKLASLEIACHDDHPQLYTVQCTDLASGQGIIGLACFPQSISPSLSDPATIVLQADVGNVLPGSYQGQLDLILQNAPERRWTADLTLEVVSPLSAEPLDFGRVAPRFVRSRPLTINNAARAYQNIEVSVEIRPTEVGHLHQLELSF